MESDFLPIKKNCHQTVCNLCRQMSYRAPSSVFLLHLTQNGSGAPGSPAVAEGGRFALHPYPAPTLVPGMGKALAMETREPITL